MDINAPMRGREDESRDRAALTEFDVFRVPKTSDFWGALSERIGHYQEWTHCIATIYPPGRTHRHVKAGRPAPAWGGRQISSLTIENGGD